MLFYHGFYSFSCNILQLPNEVFNIRKNFSHIHFISIFEKIAVITDAEPVTKLFWKYKPES
jgi:hypothetical protein